MSRDTVKRLFADGVNKADTMIRDRPQAEKETYEMLRDFLGAFFMLACDAVYGPDDKPKL